jgi:uncharacterized protein (DUF58 family)
VARSDQELTARPERRSELTPLGRAGALLAALGFLPSLAIGGPIAWLPSLAAATLAVAWLAGWRNLAGVELRVPRHARARSGERTALPTVVRASPRRPARDLVVTHANDPADETFLVRGFVGALARGQTVELGCLHRFGARGVLRSHRSRLSSHFPFGLVLHSRTFLQPIEHLVHPRCGRLTPAALSRLRALEQGPERGLDRAGSDEFHGLRPWREGESQRHVHWRRSARTGRRVLREFVGSEAPRLHVHLAPAVRGRRSLRRSRAVEDAVSLAATLVREGLRRGFTVRLTLHGARRETLDLRRGALALTAVLDRLAAVVPERVDGVVELDPEPAPTRTARGRRECHWLVAASPVHGPRFDHLTQVDERDLDLLFESPFGGEGAVFDG